MSVAMKEKKIPEPRNGVDTPTLFATINQAGIVDAIRDGRQVSYRLSHPQIHEARVIMRSILYQRLKQGEKLASAISSSRGR